MAAYVWLLLILVSPIIGSFLGLLAVRLPAHEDVVVRRSHCRSCEAPLGVRDLIPIVSWLLARGKCRHCGARVSPLYPLVELGAVAVAVSAVYTMSGIWEPITCVLGWMLLALAAADIRAFILPNVLTLPLIPLGLGVSLLIPGAPIVDHVIGIAAGGGALWFVAFAYEKLRGRTGLGMGDVKLFAGAGAWLGWMPLPYVMLLGSVLGIFAVLGFALALRRKVSATTMLPFGAPLAFAFYIVWLWQAGAWQAGAGLLPAL